MKQTYSAPSTRVVDLHWDLSLCVSTLSGGLEKTYDDLIDDDE